MNLYQENEIKLLKHLLTDPDELIPEGMEKWEVNATLDRLEKQGCLRVAWASGHEAEAVMLNDTGREHLKALEYEKGVEWNKRFEQQRKENSNRFHQSNLQRQIARETNGEILRLQAEVKRLQEENANLKAENVELKAKINNKYDRKKAIEELKFLFKNNREIIEQFLDQIEGLKPVQVTAVVNNHIKSVLINNTDASSKSLYDILNRHGLYDKLYPTWQSQVDWYNDGKLERRKEVKKNKNKK